MVGGAVENPGTRYAQAGRGRKGRESARCAPACDERGCQPQSFEQLVPRQPMKSAISVAAAGWFEAAAAEQLSRLAPAPPMQVVISSKAAVQPVFEKHEFFSTEQLAIKHVSQGPGPPLPSTAASAPASAAPHAPAAHPFVHV